MNVFGIPHPKLGLQFRELFMSHPPLQALPAARTAGRTHVADRARPIDFRDADRIGANGADAAHATHAVIRDNAPVRPHRVKLRYLKDHLK